MSVGLIEELLQDVIHETGIGDIPDFFSVVNRVTKELAKEYRWRHYATEGSITVLASYSTGTVSMTEGSGTVTGVGTTFTSAMVGRKFRGANGQGVYDITAFTDTTHITISPVWPYDDVSGESFSIYQDTYDFPSNMQQLIEIKDAATERTLEAREYVEILRRWEAFTYTEQSAVPPGFAWPWEFTQFMWNSTTKCWQVIVNAVSDAARDLDILYRRYPTAVTKITDSPDVAEYMEEVLRLRLFMHFTRRKSPQNEIEYNNRSKRLDEWRQLEVSANRNARATDGTLVIPYLRNLPVFV